MGKAAGGVSKFLLSEHSISICGFLSPLEISYPWIECERHIEVSPSEINLSSNKHIFDFLRI